MYIPPLAVIKTVLLTRNIIQSFSMTSYVLLSAFSSAFSLQEEGPQEPQQETLQQVAARIVQKAWKRYVVGADAVVGTVVHGQIKVNMHKLKLFFLHKL